MSATHNFQVDSITTNGVVVGRNAYCDIPVGAVFTSLRKSKVVGNLPDIQTIDLGEIGQVALRLDKVEWFRNFIDVIPRGHSAGLHLSGTGLELLTESLATRQEREFVSLHLPV